MSTRVFSGPLMAGSPAAGDTDANPFRRLRRWSTSSTPGHATVAFRST